MILSLKAALSMRDKVLVIVKRRLKLIENDSLDDLIEEYIEQIEMKIKSYCNQPRVPEELKFVWASMTIDILRIEHPNEQAVMDSVSDGIASVKLGDTNVSYASKGNDITSASKGSLDSLVLNYSVELNKYRRLKTI